MVTSSSEAGYQNWGQGYTRKKDLGRGPAVFQMLPLCAHPSVCTPALPALTHRVSVTGATLNNHLQFHHHITENLTHLNRSG